MISTDDIKHTHYHNKDVVMASVAGILAGAVSITALALTDKDIRKKVSKRAHDLSSSLQDWSADKLRMVDQHNDNTKIIDTVEQIEKVTEETKEDEPLKHVAIKN